MKQIIYNEDNLKDKDINRIVKRSKCLLINSQSELLLGYGHDTYQIIGGHVENNETYKECLKREALEETGIELDTNIIGPIIQIIYYNRDYPSIGVNSKYIANYYYSFCDIKPDLNRINLTDEELEGLFEYRYININKVLEELNNNLLITSKQNVVKDTIETIKEYIRISKI